MDPTVEKIITTITENRIRLEAFCHSLTDEELARPVPDSTWTVKDFALHLATLDPPLTRIFEATARDEEPVHDDGKPFDVDAYNDSVVEPRRQWPLPRVFAEGAKQREALIAALSPLAAAQLQNMMHFTGDAKRSAGSIPFVLFLAGWAQHDPIHVADMLKALPERAADPDTKAWVDNPFVAGYQKAMSGPPRSQSTT